MVETKFSFSPDEIPQIEAIHESAKGITGVEISRNYAGKYSHQFIPQNPNAEHNVDWVVDLISERLAGKPSECSDHFITQYSANTDALIKEIKEQAITSVALAKIGELRDKLDSFCHPTQPHQPQHPHNIEHQKDKSRLPSLVEGLNQLVREIEATPLIRVVDIVHKWLPTFIYMDDHQIFVGSAQLEEVLNHSQQNKLTSEEETILIIMRMAGLSLDDEVAKGKAEDREQRMLDMNDASQTLTNLIAERWSQRKYEVMFQADGQHFMTFVKDLNDKALIPLEERSKGFQWFFSFDMRLMYETDGKFKNAIILLDEPGLHLHASAQRDLLNRLKDYAEGNQLIYTTHLPFMIDFKRLDNIFVAEEIPEQGTLVHKNWATADKDARFTLQAALGLSWSQSLFVGQYNLIVEGVDDFWLLTTFSTMFEEAGQPGLNPLLVITPAGGASKVAYVGTILKGQELNVAVLLDSDAAGDRAFEQLVHQWILQDKLVIRVGDAVGANPCALEDLFGEAYYLSKVNEAYAPELKKTPLVLDPNTWGKTTIVERIETAFGVRGLGAFNKGRVAKRIMTDMSKKELATIDKESVAKFRKIIDAINSVVSSWESVSKV